MCLRKDVCVFAIMFFSPLFITINASIEEARNYLNAYGYLQDHGGDNEKITLKNALLLFQETYKIRPMDGTVNDATLEFMRRKKCGVPDSPTKFRIRQEKWKRRELKWYFHRATTTMNELAEKAFAEWARYTNLRFTRDANNPDIMISFKNYNHTFEYDHDQICQNALDGPGNQLAHAYLPGLSDSILEIHIDQTESWDFEETISNKNIDKVNLLTILIHEIGHTLGLSHSDDEKAIMYSTIMYNPKAIIENGGKIALMTDDILGVQNLYGSKLEDKTTTMPTPTTTHTHVTPVDEKGREIDLCSLSAVDGMLIVGRRMYIFYKKWVWPMNVDSKNYEKPQLITNWLRFLPANFTRIQMIYQRPSDDVILVANDQMYQFTIPNMQLREQWPKAAHSMWASNDVSRRFNGVVNSYRGNTYVFYSDNYYTRIDECYLRPAEYGLISEDFIGVPSKFNSVFRYKNGLLYFFNKKNFYEYDEFANRLVRAGKFNLNLFNIECPKIDILEQLKNLLSRLSNVITTSVDDNDDEEEED